MTLETFRAAQAGSHQAAARLLTYDTAGGTRATYQHSTSISLDGTVTFDRERQVRRALSMRLVDVDGTLAPTTVNDELANGTRVEPQRGIVVDGQVVWLSLGI